MMVIVVQMTKDDGDNGDSDNNGNEMAAMISITINLHRNKHNIINDENYNSIDEANT